MTKFSDLKLDPKVLQAVAEAGYETPTPIQAGAIPPALEGRDVLGIAQTGTGKTAGFVLPMITLLGRGRARARMPRSLVLCPTRELAAQVAENFDTYAKHTRLTKALLIGGVSFGEQDKLIDRGVDVLIATPGRLLDHFERGKLLLTGVQIMVVDEADRMLDMGFIPDIERIFQLTPPLTRQTLFFSATMAPEIERITNTFLHNPERIEVARQATTSETIVQKLVEITPTRKDQSAKQKRELLRALIDAEGPESETGGLKNAIIFCNRKTEVDIVAKSLKAHGYDAAPIHGDLEQRQRMATLDGFREGALRFLIASDVAARGLDIPAVSHVFNFDLPSHAEDYVHRIGRTGRAGRTGTAISIATPADDKYLAAIENLVKQTLPRAPLPEGFSLTEAAMSAPRPPSERGGRAPASRTRSRVRGERKPVEAAPLAEPAATAPELAEQPDARVEARPDARPEPRRRDDDRRERDDRRGDRQSERQAERGGERNGERGTDRGDERRERGNDRGNDRRGDRGDERNERNERRADRSDRDGDRRNDRGRDRDRGPAVMGMGEHVPDFLLTSFTPSIAATAARIGAAEAAEALQPAAEPQAHPAQTPQAGQAAADTPPMTQDGLDAHAEAATPAAAEVAAEPVAEAVAEAPAKPKRTRTRARKKPVEAAPEAEAAQADATQDAPAGAEADAARADAGREPAPALPEEREAVAPDAASAEAAPAVDAPATADADVPQAAPAEPPMTQDGLDAHDAPAAPATAGDQQPVPSDSGDAEPPMTEDGLDAHADPDAAPAPLSHGVGQPVPADDSDAAPPMTQDGLDAHDAPSAPAAPLPQGDQQPAPSDSGDAEPPMTEDGLDAHADPDAAPARA